jgi:hypothetical protein
VDFQYRLVYMRVVTLVEPYVCPLVRNSSEGIQWADTDATLYSDTGP